MIKNDKNGGGEGGGHRRYGQAGILKNDPKLTVSELTDIINNLNTRKATGPDLLHNKLLKAASDVICAHLTDFFNRCLKESFFSVYLENRDCNACS